MGKCSVCKKEDTIISCNVSDKITVYACKKCLEDAKENFIFICINCGKVYKRNKKEVIKRMKDLDTKRAYLICENMQIIQGVDVCISCEPNTIVDNYFENSKSSPSSKDC